jgi:ligand-binding SRPBCC domain-containing protein
MRIYELNRSQIVQGERRDVFAFFANAENLEMMTPPWLRFRITSPRPIPMQAGTRIDYLIRLKWVAMRWTSEITVWDPPFLFVDTQIRGPYRVWVHEHRFEPVPNGTRVIDFIRYAVPGGPLVHRFMVAPDLERVFDFRREKLDALFGAEAARINLTIREDNSLETDQLRSHGHDIPGVRTERIGAQGAREFRRGGESLSADKDPGLGGS